jgi:hypothetical protein
MGRLTQLTHLNLDWNGLTRLSPKLKNLTRLEQISLNHTAFTHFPAVLYEIASLRSISMTSNHLSHVSVDTILREFAKRGHESIRLIVDPRFEGNYSALTRDLEETHTLRIEEQPGQLHFILERRQVPITQEVDMTPVA